MEKENQLFDSVLIIGNDGMLGWICHNDSMLDGSLNVIILIKYGNGTKIPINKIVKYFPKGFSILYHNLGMGDTYYFESLFGTFSGMQLCNPCGIPIHSF